MNILISIKPEWAALIYSGKKNIEFRTVMPRKYELCADKIFIYETSPVRAVTGYIVVDSYMNVHNVLTAPYYTTERKKKIIKGGCMTFDDLKNFAPGKKLFGWHIINAYNWNRYESIVHFSPNEKPPQSWCYTNASIPSSICLEFDHKLNKKSYERIDEIKKYWENERLKKLKKEMGVK